MPSRSWTAAAALSGRLHRPAHVAVLLAAVGVVAFAPQMAAAHPSADARLQAVELELADTSPSAKLYVEHGEANRQAGRWQQALADADRALTLEPGWSDALLLRAAVLHAGGNVDRALVAVDALLAAAPVSAAGHHLRARVLRDVGRLEEAAAEYDRFIDGQRQPLPEHYVERAEILAALGRTDAALSTLDAGLERLGPVAPVQLAAVDLAVHARRFDNAVQRLDLLLRRTPGQVFWMTKRAEVLEMAGRVEAARSGFAAAAAALPPLRVAALRDLESRINAGRLRLGPTAAAPEPAAAVELVRESGR